MRLREMAVEEGNQDKTIRERMAEEEKVRERVDAQGVKWKKVYFGGGEHFKNWLAQCRELGEVEVEDVNSKGYKCFEETGEKLYRIWLRVVEPQGGDPY
jgi:argininosuccinate lyase